MIDAGLLEQAHGADLLATAQSLGVQLRRVTAVEWAGPCPVCAGRDRFSVNTRKQIWLCRRCGRAGDVIALVMHARDLDFRAAVAFLAGGDTSSATPDSNRREAFVRVDNRRELASALWRRRRPIGEGCPAWRYLREARGYDGAVPATLGFLPASGGHPPAMIAAFTLADEPEPGLLAVNDAAVRAVHLTGLEADGGGRIDKIILGQGALGVPIVVAPVNDLLGLAIVEGIEDGLSVFAATGLGVWVAGSAGRMPPLADAVPSYVECVTIFGHRDPAGERGAHELAALLERRGIPEILLKFLKEEDAP
jgi:putative DNA primase/helicase